MYSARRFGSAGREVGESGNGEMGDLGLLESVEDPAKPRREKYVEGETPVSEAKD